MRVYDPRLGRFLSVDPITKQYPELTPYQFASNRPIDGVDQDGLEWELSTTGERLRQNLWMKVDVANAPNRERAAVMQKSFASAMASAKTISATPTLFGYDQRVHEKNRVEMLNVNGYHADGSNYTWRNLAENKTFINAQNNLVLPILEAAVGDGLGRLFGIGGKTALSESVIGGKRMATLGEGIDVVINKGLQPGSRGVYLGPKRLTEIEMRAMSDLHKVEFAQVYTMGSGKNGGGGYYTLYSGTIDRVTLPVGSGEMLINHTHPGGTLMPSSYDVKYLWRAASEGSPQKSSSIIPNGGSTFRFNGNSPVSDPGKLKTP